MAVGAHRYRWFYVCTFVEPETGESLSLLVDEAVANRYFRDLEEMMEAVAARCRVLAQDPETLRRHTLFHWWPRTKELA